MTKYVVARVDEIAPGSCKIQDIAGRSVGIFNVDGDYFAIRNTCPHQGAPLCRGVVWNAITSGQPGEYIREERSPFLRCPWHGWEFDMRSGQSWFGPETRVNTFGVSITSGLELQTELSLHEGPYIAETYGVAVDDRFVVVEIPD